MEYSEDWTAKPTQHDIVSAAFAAREYTSVDGATYRKGMDGWFSDGGTSTHDGVTTKVVRLTYNYDMEMLIREENPE